MICELCGKEAGPTRPVFIEGTKLHVCQNCMRFGEEYKAQSAGKAGAPAPAPSATVIEERLQRREKRMQTRDVYATTQSVELVEDYGHVIREARIAAGMDLEQFAASIYEKRMQTRDVYATTQSVELVEDYGHVIREARIAAGMDLEQFAASIYEKKGTLAKVEANDLIPEEKLMRKIEKALNIKLTETVQAVTGTNKQQSSKMTLENFIKRE